MGGGKIRLARLGGDVAAVVAHHRRLAQIGAGEHRLVEDGARNDTPRRSAPAKSAPMRLASEKSATNSTALAEPGALQHGAGELVAVKSPFDRSGGSARPRTGRIARAPPAAPARHRRHSARGVVHSPRVLRAAACAARMVSRRHWCLVAYLDYEHFTGGRPWTSRPSGRRRFGSRRGAGRADRWPTCRPP